MRIYHVLFLLWIVYVILWLMNTFSANNRRKK